MLDSKLVINKGLRLVDLTTRRDFIVLCSCPNSRPRRHTSSYVRQHRDEFVTMADWQASEAKVMANMEQAIANADGTPWQARQNRSTIAQQADGNPPKETTDPSAAEPAQPIPDQEKTNVPTTDSSGPET